MPRWRTVMADTGDDCRPEVTVQWTIFLPWHNDGRIRHEPRRRYTRGVNLRSIVPVGRDRVRHVQNRSWKLSPQIEAGRRVATALLPRVGRPDASRSDPLASGEKPCSPTDARPHPPGNSNAAAPGVWIWAAPALDRRGRLIGSAEIGNVDVRFTPAAAPAS